MAFTDYFDNPIEAGDEIVYPASSHRSAARLERVTVDAVVPLIAHPDSTKSTLVREDHAQKKSPSSLRQFRETIGYGPNATPLPDEHRFVLVVREWQDHSGTWSARRTVENIRNVIVVPKGA